MSLTVNRELRLDKNKRKRPEQKRYYGTQRNASYYHDPTAFLAISHILREQKGKRKKQFHKLAAEPGVSR